MAAEAVRIPDLNLDFTGLFEVDDVEVVEPFLLLDVVRGRQDHDPAVAESREIMLDPSRPEGVVDAPFRGRVLKIALDDEVVLGRVAVRDVEHAVAF